MVGPWDLYIQRSSFIRGFLNFFKTIFWSWVWKKRKMGFQSWMRRWFWFEVGVFSKGGLFLSNFVIGKIVNILKFWRGRSLVKRLVQITTFLFAPTLQMGGIMPHFSAALKNRVRYRPAHSGTIGTHKCRKFLS